MAQKLIQTQEQRQLQQQRLSAQQMLQVRLLEMPITELEESINAELYDNPALEAAGERSADDGTDAQDYDDSSSAADDFDAANERSDREEALDNALQGIGRDDDMPQASYQNHAADSKDYEEMVYGDNVSFYDRLKEQMMELDLSDDQKAVMEYLIGSLDSDGLLRKPIDSIADELAIYHNIDCTEQQIEQVLALIHDFDPPGIGARTLQECLLIQVDRWLKNLAEEQATPISHTNPQSPIPPNPSQADNIRLMREIIDRHFDEFTKKHWDKLRLSMHLSDAQIDGVKQLIRRLNPKPGASMGETEGRNIQQITPDFIIDTDDDGNVSFTLNQAGVPELYVSPSFTAMMETYRDNKKGMTRQDKEALLYLKEKIDKAQGYIEAVRQRRRTLRTTMQAIIDWQQNFFATGDESELRPMILKDIAERTGLDISTISRVSNIKYAETRWGVFPLRFFFSDGYATGDGEETSTRKIKLALKDIIQAEDKQHPLSDEQLAAMMKDHGYPIARRTVSKYREQMGIPVARLRK